MTEPYDDAKIESKLAQARAFLAKAEATDSEEERDACNAKATDLLAKYGIDRARLAESNPHSDTPTTREVIVPGPHAAQKAVLLLDIAQAMRGNGVYFGTRTPAKRVVLYGFSSDLERAEMLFTSLLVQMAHALAKAQVPWTESLRSFRTSWIVGFRHLAVKRIRAHEQRAAKEAVTDSGTGMDLVLASRGEVAKKMKQDAYPKARPFKSTLNSRAGLLEGIEAGKRADIGVTKVGQPATRGLPAAN